MSEPFNILFISDLHLPLGPREPIRPELRARLRPLGRLGKYISDRFEERLRLEAKMVRRCASRWLKNNTSGYDLIINGGDNALPLEKHEDRISSAHRVWRHHIQQFGETRYLAITGNHELGHGYDADPKSYQGLMDLRQSLFSRPINRDGYGIMEIEGVSLLALDSELIYLRQAYPDNELFRYHHGKMQKCLEILRGDDSGIVIVTHNTSRVVALLKSTGLWYDLIGKRRQAAIIGGHYHMQRFVHYRGARIFWAGGASYPEPLLRWMVRTPFTGFLPGGAGGVDIRISSGHMFAAHRSFGIRCGITLPNYRRKK